MNTEATRRKIHQNIDQLLALFGNKVHLSENYRISHIESTDLEMAKNVEIKCHELEPSSLVNFDSPEKVEDLKKIFKELQENNQMLVLKSKEQQYIGHIGYEFEADSSETFECRISFISIEPKYQKQGLSLLLIMKALQELKDRGAKFVSASTSNHKLLALFDELQIEVK